MNNNNKKKLLENIFSEGGFLSAINDRLNKANKEQQRLMHLRHEEYLKHREQEKAAYNKLKSALFKKKQTPQYASKEKQKVKQDINKQNTIS